MDIRQMPFGEKRALAVENTDMMESFAKAFFMERLGEGVVSEFRGMLESGIREDPKGASMEQRYETAYENWIWTVKSAYALVHKRMDAEGLEAFKRAEVEALKRKNRGPTLLLLSVVRAVSPAAAFRTAMKQMAYRMQWITTFSVPELTGRRTVLSMPRCKILDHEDVYDVCYIGCQQVYPMWLAEQFKVNAEFHRLGTGCTCTITPVR